MVVVEKERLEAREVGRTDFRLILLLLGAPNILLFDFCCSLVWLNVPQIARRVIFPAIKSYKKTEETPHNTMFNIEFSGSSPSSRQSTPRGTPRTFSQQHKQDQSPEKDNKQNSSSHASTGSIQYERIFTNSEILALEGQIRHLVSKQKDMKSFVKEEFKNFRSRLEKELRDAQQEGKIELAITIEKALDLTSIHSKVIDDEIDRDVALLDEQTKLLKNLRYEKDYWKELELKMIIGDSFPSEESFVQDVDEHYAITLERITLMMKNIRTMVDKLEYNNVVRMLDDLNQPIDSTLMNSVDE